MKKTKHVDKSKTKHIAISRKQVTILFTDIEQSTEYWDTFGDLEGRLLVDRHNRLLFPIVKQFRGKIIKTIGDAIMASFRKPQDAVKAAIAMQQILAKERADDELFKLQVRIGIHTGDAIVEKNDVFGDVVNVAAKVENEAEGNEILITGSTFGEFDDSEFTFVDRGKFKPKGKKIPISLYRCKWEKYENLIDDMRLTSYLPVIRRQKFQLLLYFITAIAFLYFLYLKYIRYLISDSESVALLFLNPKNLINEHPWILIICGLVIITTVVLLFRLKTIPHFMLPLLQGGFGFSIGFIVFYLFANFLPLKMESKWNEIIYRSDHLFVEVLEDESLIYEEASLNSTVIDTVDMGSLLLLSGVLKRENLRWNKVLVEKKKWGWILRMQPAQIGILEKRISIANKFYFRYTDLYAFILGFLIFIWSFFRFRVHPV